MTEQEKAALLEAVAFVQAAYADGGTPVAVVVDGRPVEFSFLPLTQYSGADLVEYGSYSELLESYYAAKDKAERLRQKSRDLAKTVHNLHERAVRKAAARREEQAQSAASEELRVYGELLSANLWAIQRGAKNVTLTNYYDGKEVTIPLDVRLSPSANAQKYFKEYKKKQTAARMLTELIAESDAEAEYLATVQYEVETAEGEAALAEIRAELKSQGYLKYYKAKDKKQKPADFLRYVSSDGFPILVGRNNAQNDRLTLKTARGRDVWFHVKNAPGSHAVVLSGGQPVPDTTKTEAAVLALQPERRRKGAGGLYRGAERLEGERGKARHGAVRPLRDGRRHAGPGAGGAPAGEMSRRGKITKRRPVKIGGSVQSVKSKISYKIYQKPLHCAGVFGIIIRRLRMPCIFAGQRYALTREVAALCAGFSAEYVRSMNRAKEY